MPFLSRNVSGVVLLTALVVWRAAAFPPAPPHEVYGLVRDQLGNPLGDGAQILFEASAGAKLSGDVAARTEPGVNFSLEVPMDAGLTDDLYQPTALLPAAPFRLKVRVGRTTYLPIEMKADLARLGLPGQRTRIDLTLGEDADGNGLPDAWEKAVAAYLGRTWQPGQISPDQLYPGTGLTYHAVYVSGTYAMAPQDGFALDIATDAAGTPVLAFTAVKGRTYTVELSSTFNEWSPVPIRLLPAPADAAPVWVWQATETKRVELAVPGLGTEPAGFFRLLVQ